MYIAFGNRVVDSMDMKKLIEDNTEFKVIKDMSKGSKREDIVAFNLSMSIDLLNEELSEELTDVNFVKVDIDQSMDLAQKFRIVSVPTMKIFKNGEEVDTLMGFMPKDVLKSKVEAHL